MPATPESQAQTRAFARVIGPWLVIVPGIIMLRAPGMGALASEFFKRGLFAWFAGALLLFGGPGAQEVLFAVNTLGYSRRFHFVAMECEDVEHTYESLILSFEYLDGVTQLQLGRVLGRWLPRRAPASSRLRTESLRRQPQLLAIFVIPVDEESGPTFRQPAGIDCRFKCPLHLPPTCPDLRL